MSVTIIFLSLFILVILFYLMIRLYSNQKYYNPVLFDFEVKGQHYGNADNGYIVDPKYQESGVTLPLNNKTKIQMPEFSDRLQYTYLMSVFIENNLEIVNSEESQQEASEMDRCIMTRNDSPGFYYRPSTNEFIIKIKHTNNFQDLVISDLIQQQSWLTIICVFNNRSLEIYRNGTLHTSIDIENVPQPDSCNVTLYPNYGIYGNVSYIHYFNKALEPWKIPIMSQKSCPFFWWLFV